ATEIGTGRMMLGARKTGLATTITFGGRLLLIARAARPAGRPLDRWKLKEGAWTEGREGSLDQEDIRLFKKVSRHITATSLLRLRITRFMFRLEFRLGLLTRLTERQVRRIQ